MSLKMNVLFSSFAFVLTLASAQAADFECGQMKIPEAALAGFGKPECVGANYRMAVLQGNAGGAEKLRVIGREYNATTKEYEFKTTAEIAKESSDALREYCGRGLSTARIIANGDAVLLIYSQATVVKWDLASNTVRELATRRDPNVASTCGGSDVGPNAMVDQMIFREGSNGNFILFDLYDELVRVDF